MTDAETGGQDYMREWYAKHRDELSERKKRRYQDDPEYRAACLARSRQRYSEKRSEIRAAARRRTVAILGRGRRERIEEVVTIGGLARTVGRSINTLRMIWIPNGGLPETPLRRGGIRYYTPAMVEAVASCKPEEFRKDWARMGRCIERQWRRLGVYGARIDSVVSP